MAPASRIFAAGALSEAVVMKLVTEQLKTVKTRTKKQSTNEVKLSKKDICWDDLGGMDVPKREILDCVDLPTPEELAARKNNKS